MIALRDREEGSRRLPSLSIVVVALRGGDATSRLLDALTKTASSCEILVAAAYEDVPRPGVQWIAPPEDASVPARRSFGAGRSSGEIVAFLEDTVAPDPRWGDAVRTLYASHPNAEAIGGTMRLDTSALSPAALALALLDAGRFVRDAATSEVASALPGCNLSFRRDALERLGALSGAPLREAEAIPALASRPGAVRLESDMSATFVAADETGLTAASRFQHGRLYAGQRGASLAERWGRALLAPLLPFVLVYRCWQVAARASVRPLAPVLAHAFRMAGAWSLGEAVGYLLGPGEAERHWR